MDRRKDNVVPFRRPARKTWTRAEDFLPGPPRPTGHRGGRWRAACRTAGVWLAIAALIAATVAATIWL